MDDQTPADPAASEHAIPAAPPAPWAEPGAPVAVAENPSWFRRHRRALAITGAAALCLTLGGGGAAVIALQRQAQSASYASPYTGTQNGTSGSGTSGSGTSGPQGFAGPGQGFGSQGSSGGTSTQSSATTASAAQIAGIVTITTTVEYGQGTAAGTGMVLTSNGQVLTNNHVVQGSTAIKVTIQSTGQTYTADVVGTDSVDDVALLQLEGASGLTTVSASTSGVSTGQSITDVGNAQGTGTLVAASGTVTATGQQITVQDDLTGAPKTLTGLIQLNADIVSGDSGGPILDSSGRVVGIATAASSGTRTVTGYAIPIDTALSVVKQIRSGVATSTVHIGLPAFLGVQLSSAQSGAGVAVSGVIGGSGAAAAGLGAGDTITAVDGTPVTTADSLSTIVASHKVGDAVAITYTDAAGATATVTVTLGSGPAA